jgi:type IV pilus assembly protein PilO
MAFGLPTDQRSQMMLLLVIAAAAGGYFFWSYGHQPKATKIAATSSEIDSLTAIVEAAKRDLASGTMEDLRRTVDAYKANLQLMRRLVPENNEVPKLMDDISTRIKVRGLTQGKFQPLGVEAGQPFDTYRYRYQVYGHFDQIGEFLADVASLPRIIVPQDLNLHPATPATERLLTDTAGGLLEVDLVLRTYVKAAAPPPSAAKPPAKPARPAGGADARN